MAIPDEDVAKVRATTDIGALIGEHTTLKRVGRRLVGLCPFHSEKSPSFSVNAEEGLYYCFGCQASGDAISFIRRIDGIDFVEAVERLAGRAGVTIHNDADPADQANRQKRQALYDALDQAATYYHELLLNDARGSKARQYLRSRGYDGDVVRRFKIGFAPTSWDALIRSLKFPQSILIEAGLALENSRGRLQDAFRERVLFPISDTSGRVIAFGGRVMPEELRENNSSPGPKYRNSPESPIYRKRATLYGLNYAKDEIARTRTAVVCEGYTDVIGFFEAGVERAVATCGTALTEEHFKVLNRFAQKVVLCFDQDGAGQNAAARLYEWERSHELELMVAALPTGSDPADLARTNPEALRLAVEGAKPFLGFQVERALERYDLSAPEGRTRAAEAAIAAIAEHPNDLMRDQYLVVVADRTRHDPDQLRPLLSRARADALANPLPAPSATTASPATRSDDEPPPRDEPEYFDEPEGEPGDPSRAARRPSGARELHAGRDALALAIHRPEEAAPWFDAVLFVDEDQKAAFVALCAASELHDAIARAPGVSSELILRIAATTDADSVDVQGTYLELVRLAATRASRALEADARRAVQAGDDAALAAASETGRWLKGELELMRDPLVIAGRPSPAIEAANRLLAWMKQGQREG